MVEKEACRSFVIMSYSTNVVTINPSDCFFGGESLSLLPKNAIRLDVSKNTLSPKGSGEPFKGFFTGP